MATATGCSATTIDARVTLETCNLEYWLISDVYKSVIAVAYGG